MIRNILLAAAACFLAVAVSSCDRRDMGIFTSAEDIGTVSVPGTCNYDRRDGTYSLSASGINVWGRKDACEFVWKKVEGDFDISGVLAFEGEGVNGHRKTGFMLRESLDAGARYADIAIHGDGLTSFQYRPEKDGETFEVRSPKTSKGTVAASLSRRGNIISIRSGNGNLPGEDDVDVVLDLPATCYVGIFLCSHEEDVVEKVVYRDVVLDEIPSDIRISIFCDHIGAVASQNGLSFAQAATLVRKIGYRGADVRVRQRDGELRALDSLGFDHACAIADINYAKDNYRELEDEALLFMERNGFSRLLLVPTVLGEGTPASEKSRMRQMIASFTDRAAGKGFSVMVEDFDNPRSLCYNTVRLDSLFAVSPGLSLVFDSGNFLFCGDDVMESLAHFSGRVGHVHLKDRVSSTDMKCVPVCTGCIPVGEIVSTLKKEGYSGYYTVEQYGSRNMLEDCTVSWKNVFAVLDNSR